MITVNTQGAKSTDDLVSGFPAPGRYHAIVNAVDATMTHEKYPDQIMVEFQILAGTVPGQAGRKISTFFSVKKDAGAKRFAAFAVATGLTGLGEVKTIDPNHAIGRQLVIEVEEQEYQGKISKRVSWSGIYGLDHKDANDVPKDNTHLATHRPTSAAAAQSASPATAAPGKFSDV